VAQKQQKRKKLSIFQRIMRYWRETVGELRKVTWPTSKEAWDMTKVVLVVMVIMSIVLGLLDFGFSQLIRLLVTA